MQVFGLSDVSVFSLLEHDQIFVEYFNEFLLLPIFNQKYQWDEKEGIFKDLSNIQSSSPIRDYSPDVYTLDEAHSKLITTYDIHEFIQKHRVSHFLHSKLHRTYKLFRTLFAGDVSTENIRNESVSLESCENVSSIHRSVSFRLPDEERGITVKRTPKRRPQTHFNLPPIHKQGNITRARSYPTFQSTDFEKIIEDTGITEDSGRCSVLEFSREDSSALLELNRSSTPTPNIMTDFSKQLFQSADDMNTFIDFINANLPSSNLLTLWFAVEQLKEYHCMDEEEAALLSISHKEMKIKIFRFIQERFRFHLTNDAMAEIMRGVSDDEVALQILIQAQDDVLERLKNYWLPRYLLHRYNKVNQDESLYARNHSPLKMFPSMSVVKSLPLYGDQVKHETISCTYSEVVKFTNERWMSGKGRSTRRSYRNNVQEVKEALLVEKDVGSPFTLWMKGNTIDDSDWLMFWLDVNSYGNDLKYTEDRFLRLSLLWKLFHKHLYEGNHIASAEECAAIRNQISLMKEITKEIVVKIFSTLQNAALWMLEGYWNEYIDQDSIYTKPPHRNESPSAYLLNEGDFVGNHAKSAPASLLRRWVRRHPGSTESQRRIRLHTALSIAERGDSKRFRRPKPPTPERDDESSVQEQLLDHNDVMSDSDVGEDTDEEEGEENDFTEGIKDLEIVSKFKQFIQNEEGRELMNDLLLYLDIETYLSTGLGRQEQKQQTAMAIYDMFFDKNSRRACDLPDVIVNSVRNHRPNSATLREAQHYITPNMQQCYKSFKEYVVNQEEEKESNSKQGKKQSRTSKSKKDKKSQLEHGDGDRQKLKRKRRKGHGRGPITKEDRHSFVSLLSSSSSKQRHLREVFRKYILQGESSGFPKLEKDFLFCFECHKFKELFPYLDEYALNKKAETIVDVFLDSASPPWLQVDVTPDIASRISQRVQQTFAVNRRIPRDQKDLHVFDEAVVMVTKELLPYWSGFQQARRNNEVDSSKLTRSERKQLRLYKEFLNFSPVKTFDVKPGSPSLEGSRKSHLLFSLLKGGKWTETPIRNRKKKITNITKATSQFI